MKERTSFVEPRPDAIGRDTVRTLEAGAVRLAETLYAPSLRLPPHGHEDPHLCLVVDGEYRETWGDVTLVVRHPAVVFHLPDVIHTVAVSERGARCLNVGLDPGELRDVLRGPRIRDGLLFSQNGIPLWLTARLRAELWRSDDVSSLAVEGLVLALFADLVRTSALPERREPPAWLRRVRERIDDEVGRRFTLEELAAQAGVHRVHVARAFKDHYGSTVGSYVRRRRIEKAVRLLAEPNRSLSSVAYAAGFADQSHFTRTFRRLVGTTPARFRASFR